MDASEIGVDTAGDAYLPQSGNGGYSTISVSLSLRDRIARNRLCHLYTSPSPRDKA